MTAEIGFKLPANYVKIFLSLLTVIFAVGCTSLENKPEPAQPEPPITWGEQRVINANVFAKQGQYEKDSSFKRRQAAAVAADKFFASIGKENCVIKNGSDNICYRAFQGGHYESYKNGVAGSDGLWKRVHDAFCVNNSCQPVDTHRIQPFETYIVRYTGVKPDTATKPIPELQAERVELVVRSMACYQCRRGHWQSSIAKIAQSTPMCAAKLNIHKALHGALGINAIKVGVSDTNDGKGNGFVAAAEVADPKHKTKVNINTFSAPKPDTDILRTAACYSELDLVREF